VIYDALGSYDTPEEFFQPMLEAGVQVHAFHTARYALQQMAFFQTMNRRDHRKLTIIDDRVAYFGGMNIIDQSGMTSADDVRARHLPTSAGWRDVHVRIEGPQVPEIAEAFDRLWRKVHRQPRAPWPRWPIKAMLAERGDAIYFFDSRPRFRFRRPARVLAPLIRQARRRLTVSMAYFIPVGPVLKELLRARRRGVEVQVIIPGQSDVRLVQWATRHFYEKLLRRGIEIHERQDQMLHSKVMVIDDVWSVIGSCNLDPRSLFYNLEFLSVIRSPELAAAVGEICQFERHHSRQVTLDDCRRRTWTERLLDRFAWSLRRWL
jgi:cardiolipin synthase